MNEIRERLAQIEASMPKSELSDLMSRFTAISLLRAREQYFREWAAHLDAHYEAAPHSHLTPSARRSKRQHHV